MDKQVRRNRLTEAFRNGRDDREILMNAINSDMPEEDIAGAYTDYLWIELIEIADDYPQSPVFVESDDPKLEISEDRITYKGEEAAITDTDGGTYFETGNDKLDRVLDILYNDGTTTDAHGNLLGIDKVAWLGGANYQYADEENNTTYFFK